VIQAVDTPESAAAPAPGGTDIEEILDGDDTSK
jgi:hypothetical protein